jgi:hypothetical protein
MGLPRKGAGVQDLTATDTSCPSPRLHCVNWRPMCCGQTWSATPQKGRGNASLLCVCSALTSSVLAAKVCSLHLGLFPPPHISDVESSHVR